MENTLTPPVTTDEAAVQPAQDQQDGLQAQYDFAARHMGAGRSDAQIQALLLENGLTTEAAETVVSELRTEFRALHRADARKDMLHGGLWVGGGLLVTGATYALASEGGSYVMTWGAVIFGGYQFLKGLVNSLRKY